MSSTKPLPKETKEQKAEREQQIKTSREQRKKNQKKQKKKKNEQQRVPDTTLSGPTQNTQRFADTGGLPTMSDPIPTTHFSNDFPDIDEVKVPASTEESADEPESDNDDGGHTGARTEPWNDKINLIVPTSDRATYRMIKGVKVEGFHPPADETQAHLNAWIADANKKGVVPTDEETASMLQQLINKHEADVANYTKTMEDDWLKNHPEVAATSSVPPTGGGGKELTHTPITADSWPDRQDVQDLDPASDQGINNCLRAIKAMRPELKPNKQITLLMALHLRNATVKCMKGEAGLDDRNGRLRETLEHAEQVATRYNVAGVEDLFEAAHRSHFGAVSTNAQFNQMMVATLRNHFETSVSRATGNVAGAARYAATVAQYANICREDSQSGPMDEGISDTARRFKARFERRAAASTGGQYAAHYQNENANTYYVLGLTVAKLWYSEIVDPATHTLEQIQEGIITLFASVHFGCQESQAKLRTHILRLNGYTILGVEMLAFWTKLLDSNFFEEGNTKAFRDARNSRLTNKRLARLTAVITGQKSLWNISIGFSPARMAHLYDLWVVEQKLENHQPSKDMKFFYSESIVWYITLGKHKLMNPLTDDQEQSAEHLLEDALGVVRRREVRIRPGQKPFESMSYREALIRWAPTLLDNPAGFAP